MDENLKLAVIERLIHETKCIIESVYYEIMMGVIPDLHHIETNDSLENNITNFMMNCCSETIAHLITVDKTITMEEGMYLSMLIYPMLTGKDMAETIKEVIPENHLMWLAQRYELTYKGKHLDESVV